MKKGKSQTLFTQRLLAQLSKLKDSCTIASGHLQIKQLLAQTQLDDAQTIFSTLQNDNSSERAKKQYIRVYTSMIQVYGLQIFQYFEKFIQVLMKKTNYPSETAETFAALTKLITTIPDQQQQLQRLYQIQQLFQQCTKDAFVGICLRCIIKQLPAQLLSRMESQLCQFLVVRTLNSKSKVQLIQAILSLLLALQESFEQDDLVRGLVENDIKNEDWNVRKSVIDMFYALLVLKGPSQEDNKILEMVKQAKYDKIKTVRDAAANCLSIFKQTNQTEQKPTQKKEIMKPWKSQTQQIKPKQTAIKTTKNERNQSFFKKAKLQNQITISQPPQTSSIQLTEVPLDRMSKSNYQKRNINDTIQQIQSMMPKGLSVAESMVFRYDESKDFQEEKKMEQSSPIIEAIQQDSSKQPNRQDKVQKQLLSFKNFIIGFQKSIIQKLNKLEERVQRLQTANFQQKLDAEINQNPPLNNNYLIIQHPSSRRDVTLSISKQEPHTINMQPYIYSKQHSKQQIKNFSEGQASIHQKMMNQLQNHNVQGAYEIAFTEGVDQDIIWLMGRTGMVIGDLDKLHGDLLVYKVREFVCKGIEVLMCLGWLQQYFKYGQRNCQIQWGGFIRKIKCCSAEDERIKKRLLDVHSRVQGV